MYSNFGVHLDYSQCFLDIVSMLSGDIRSDQIARILLVTLKSVYVIGSILR